MLLRVSRPWTIFRQLIRKFSLGYTMYIWRMLTSWDAGKMSSFINLHVTNLMFVFVATFRKYLGSFVEEVFLIIILNFSSRHRLHRFYMHLRVLRWTISLEIGGHNFLVSRCILIAQCPFHVPDHETISCGYNNNNNNI